MAKFRKKTSMQDIADHLGVSKNAVSMALNNKPGIGEKLRAQITQAAEILNYADYGLRKKRRLGGNLLVFTADRVHDGSKNLSFHEVLKAIEQQSLHFGLETIIKPISQNMEEKLLFPEFIELAHFQGAVFLGAFSEEYTLEFKKFGIPIVLVDNDYDLDLELDSVVTSHRIGAKKMIYHLIEQGHRKIGFIAPIKQASAFRERWRAFRDVMEEMGLGFCPEFCLTDGLEGEDLPWDDTEVLFQQIRDLEQHPTAWMCGNDAIAIALIKVLNRQRIQVPDDVSVVGFDDIELAKQIIPELTTIRVKRRAIGKKAVDMIINRINHPDDTHIRVGLFSELVIRESVRTLDI